MFLSSIDLNFPKIPYATEVIDMIRLKPLRCSFCGKKDSQVEKLVAGRRPYSGARVYICDGCVAIATQIMNDPPNPDNPAGVKVSNLRKVSDRVRRFIRGGHPQRISLPSVP